MKSTSPVPAAVHSDPSRVCALISAHFFVDMLSWFLAGFLPVLQKKFGFGLASGTVVFSCVAIGCNLMQIPASGLGRRSRESTWIVAGILLSGSIVLLAALPTGTPVWVLCLLMLVVGAGVAVTHPAALRGTQNIGTIPGGIVTPLFMTGGFLGGAAGPFVSGVIVGNWGLRGLYWLLIPMVLIAAAVKLSNVKLVRDDAPEKNAASNPVAAGPVSPWSFTALMTAGLFMNTATSLFQMLLPTYLHADLGFSLGFGGFSAMLFGAGSAAGSVALGFLSARRDISRILEFLPLAGIPFLLSYFLLSGAPAACLLAVPAGMLLSSAFPIFVAMSRSAKGTLPLSTRMGLIVGGTWGGAAVIFLIFGQLAARIGLARVMTWGCTGFYALAFLCLFAARTRGTAGKVR